MTTINVDWSYLNSWNLIQNLVIVYFKLKIIWFYPYYRIKIFPKQKKMLLNIKKFS